MGWLLFSAAIAPVVFMLHFVYVRDKYEREPLGRVLLVYFVSFITVIPAAIFESWFNFSTAGWLGLAVTVWLVVAVAEETVKYLALRWLAVPHRSFNEVYDGIIYGVAASLGFATVENLAYVFMSAEDGLGSGLGVAMLRAVLSVPGHALWGVMMGYYVGLAKFAETKQEQRRLVRRGLLTAIFWHGLYDFFAFGVELASGALLLLMLAGLIVVVVVNWRIAFHMIRDAQERSVFKRPHLLVNPIGALAFNWKYCHHCGCPAQRSQAFCQRCGDQFPR
jgi:protease PrsW